MAQLIRHSMTVAFALAMVGMVPVDSDPAAPESPEVATPQLPTYLLRAVSGDFGAAAPGLLVAEAVAVACQAGEPGGDEDEGCLECLACAVVAGYCAGMGWVQCLAVIPPSVITTLITTCAGHCWDCLAEPPVH